MYQRIIESTVIKQIDKQYVKYIAKIIVPCITEIDAPQPCLNHS